MDEYHIPVLLNEAIEALRIKQNEKYIDCNLGGGGHTEEILKKGGLVLGLDVDENAVKFCEKRFVDELKSGRLQISKQNFANITEAAEEIGWKKGEIAGIIYDLGLSTFQLKKSDKGFSFMDESVLDMRMDKNLQVTANDLLKALSEKELERLIREYGEDPQAKIFAKSIKEYLKKAGSAKDFTGEKLGEILKKASKYKESRIHPATRVFQALRIAVNSELINLHSSLEQAAPLLKPEGRLAIITFHSLEDKLAKDVHGLKAALHRPKEPSAEEILNNPSARSARLRIYEKN